MSIQVLGQSEQYLHCLAMHSSFYIVYIIGIYAQSSRAGKRELWADLQQLRQGLSARPWLVVGTFNCLVSADASIGPVPPDIGSSADFCESM